MLALDLVVLHRESKQMSVRQALGRTVVWIMVALSFAGLVYGVYEHHWFGWRVAPDALLVIGIIAWVSRRESTAGMVDLCNDSGRGIANRTYA
ncbi:hypothetical protein JM946_07625 [Steroidobacter sp. S1-65]|uniref:Uncharacterized protein n=1 Tax=Steroidobacter gossypii TaxID=2805490 RepID=A0ABS1WUG9_9GAMM|nr:hypothetical protein [Steroidobacter gossypii]MBM0104610.1 hypothetical protein [Steroidobacter gossypii]